MLDKFIQQIKNRVGGNIIKLPGKDGDYFEQATEWSNDRYHFMELSRDRYRLAFFSSMALSFALTVSIALLLPLKKIEPIIVHQNDRTGEVWVAPMTTPYVPANQAQVESQLVGYVIARESYSTIDYNNRYQQVEFQSNDTVGKQYATAQDISTQTSPLNVLGESGTRSIAVEDVIFIDKSGLKTGNRPQRNLASHNLAQVNFVETDNVNGNITKQYKVATISWKYLGTPSNPQAVWENWNGFTVTYYHVDQRNVPN